MIDPRRVEYLPISEIVPDSRNPKAHDLETIDASIGRFGVLDLIVKDERTGYIISGHGRRTTLSAMQDRGETPPKRSARSQLGRPTRAVSHIRLNTQRPGADSNIRAVLRFR